MASIPVRDGISTKAEIAAALRDSLTGVSGWISTQPESHFTTGPSGRWTAGQHLEHLVRSVQPLTMGMSMPKFVLGIALGTMKRPSMPYAELAEKYEGVLDAGGKAGGRYVPPAVPASKKSTLLRAHRQQLNKLLVKMDRFTEAELDHYGAKHPLIGMLSLRELLFFTVHHHDHHLHTLQRDYTA
jgi:hypothetical protein